MKTRRSVLRPALLVFLLAAGVVSGVAGAVQDVPKPPAAKPAVEAAAPKEIHPTFLTPREKNGAYVFVGWIWRSIGVLLYVLRLKVKEADRVFLAGFYEDQEGGKEPAKHA